MPVEKDIPVLRISYRSAVPEKAANVVNALSAAYIADYIEEKYKFADTTAEFLHHQLQDYSKKLSASEGAIEQYRDQKRIVNINQETETDLRKIADLKKQLASVKMNLNAVDSLRTYLGKGKEHFLELAPNFESFNDLLSTELVKKANELQRERRDLLTRYTPEYEKVKVIDDKIDDITQYLEESIKNTTNNLQIKYNDLQKTIDESEKAFDGLAMKEKNMGILERNFSLNEQIYRFLEGKRTEAEIAKAATISFHRVISPGEVPVNPVSPNATVIKVLAAILGMFGGIGIIYVIHTYKARVNNEETINRLSDSPIAVAVPYFKKESQIRPFFLRHALQMQIKGELNEGAVIAVSSFNSQEGKRFLTNGMATAIAQLVNQVVVLDAAQVVNQAPAQWQAYLNDLKQKNTVVLVKNQSITEAAGSLIVMAQATVNLVILDSRRSKKACIPEADELKEKLQLSNMQFILNRTGYIPSLFTQVKEMLRSLNRKTRA